MHSRSPLARRVGMGTALGERITFLTSVRAFGISTAVDRSTRSTAYGEFALTESK